MAVHFSKAFNIGQGSITFYFNRIHTPDGVRYHISTVVRNNRVIIFQMAQKANSNKWTLIDRENMDWLADLEEEFSNTISQNISLDKKNKN